MKRSFELSRLLFLCAFGVVRVKILRETNFFWYKNHKNYCRLKYLYYFCNENKIVMITTL